VLAVQEEPPLASLALRNALHRFLRLGAVDGSVALDAVTMSSLPESSTTATSIFFNLAFGGVRGLLFSLLPVRGCTNSPSDLPMERGGVETRDFGGVIERSPR